MHLSIKNFKSFHQSSHFLEQWTTQVPLNGNKGTNFYECTGELSSYQYFLVPIFGLVLADSSIRIQAVEISANNNYSWFIRITLQLTRIEIRFHTIVKKPSILNVGGNHVKICRNTEFCECSTILFFFVLQGILSNISQNCQIESLDYFISNSM